MPKRRTRKRINGGNPTETKFREYASKIANKEPVSIESFTAFLDSVDDPLKVAIDYDKKGKSYTINEYALLHNASYDIHAVFWKYEVALNHLVDYSSLFDFTPFRIEDAQYATPSPLITAHKVGVYPKGEKRCKRRGHRA